MAEPLLDLGKTNLAREAQIFAVRAILSGCKLGHGRDSLPAGITGEDSISLHTPMVTRRKIRVNLGRGARLIHSGCGAAWLARLLGVQEVPGSNPGSPTKYLKALQPVDLLRLLLWRPTGVQKGMPPFKVGRSLCPVLISQGLSTPTETRHFRHFRSKLLIT